MGRLRHAAEGRGVVITIACGIVLAVLALRVLCWIGDNL